MPPKFFIMKSKSFKEELTDQLMALDRKAESLGALKVREMIKEILSDMTEPAGKTNALLAIPDIRSRLKEFRISQRESGTREVSDDSKSSMDFDEAVAQ